MGGPRHPTLKDALKKAIKLGLDLRGRHSPRPAGQHRRRGESRTRRRDRDAPDARPRTLGLGPVELPTDSSFTVTVTPQTDQAKLEETAKRFLPDWTYQHGGGKWVFALKDPSRRADRGQRRRPGPRDDPQPRRRVRRGRAADRPPGQGPHPGPAARASTIPKRVKDLIKNTAFLELSLVEKGPSTGGRPQGQYPGDQSQRSSEAKAVAGQPRALVLRRAEAGRHHGPRPQERPAVPGPVRIALGVLLPDGRAARRSSAPRRAPTSTSSSRSSSTTACSPRRTSRTASRSRA